MIMPSIKRIHI